MPTNKEIADLIKEVEESRFDKTVKQDLKSILRNFDKGLKSKCDLLVIRIPDMDQFIPQCNGDVRDRLLVGKILNKLEITSLIFDLEEDWKSNYTNEEFESFFNWLKETPVHQMKLSFTLINLKFEQSVKLEKILLNNLQKNLQKNRPCDSLVSTICFFLAKKEINPEMLSIPQELIENIQELIENIKEQSNALKKERGLIQQRPRYV